MKNEHTFLKQFQKALKDEEYDCSLVEATDVIPYERLLVFLGVDDKERERILEITALRQEFFKELIPGESHEPEFFRVQYQIGLPFKIKLDACVQVSSFICYLNRLIELPGFEMDEINLQLSYRYVLMYGEEKFNKKLFLSIVGLTLLVLELFGSSLEKVASGETTFNELLEQIVHMAQHMKQ